jgi:hypothetical protein
LCRAAYSALVIGALAARSLVACALRVAPSIVASVGALSMTRYASAPQWGQAQGSLRALMGRKAEKSPQSSQKYS